MCLHRRRLAFPRHQGGVGLHDPEYSHYGDQLMQSEVKTESGEITELDPSRVLRAEKSYVPVHLAAKRDELEKLISNGFRVVVQGLIRNGSVLAVFDVTLSLVEVERMLAGGMRNPSIFAMSESAAKNCRYSEQAAA